MISRINRKIFNFLSPLLNKRQAGVTLLLAILLLSSILAISFSLATVLFIEVRDAGDLIKTEPALYAATGVGEQAFFNLERQTCTGNGAYCYNSSFSNNVTLATTTVVSNSTPIFTDVVKTGATFANTPNNYSFCNVTSGTSGCGFGKVTINYITTNNSSDPLYVYLCEFDPSGYTNYSSAPCSLLSTSTTTQPYWKQPTDGSLQNVDGSVTLTPTNATVSWTITNSNYQQELFLTNPNGTGNIYVKISTYADQAGTIGKGLPYVGKTVVDVTTINAAVGRKIEVVVPNSNAGSSNSSIALSQSNHFYPNNGSASGGTLSLAFTKNTQKGNFIVVAGSSDGKSSPASQPTCSDTGGDIFSTLPAYGTGFSGSNVIFFVCYAVNIAGGSDTVTMSGMGDDPGINIMEFSGMALSSSLDFAAFTNTGANTTNPTSNSWTSTTAKDLILALYGDEDTAESGPPTIAAGPNLTLIQADGGHVDAQAYWANVSLRSSTDSFTIPTADSSWAILTLGFKG